MTAPQTSSLLRLFGQRKMAALFFLGFSSGVPLYLTSRTLQAWLTVEGIDLTTLGLVSLISLPYSIKFLWAPFMDRYVPFLDRRRGWMIVTQLLLLIAIATMSLQDPRRGLLLLVINAFLIAFFSASQDVGVDGYSVDVVADREVGAGASLKVLGYRIAMILTGGVALVLADSMPWPRVYLLVSGLMLVGLAASLLAPRPVLRESPPMTLHAAVIEPFRDFFRRAGAGTALLILAFVVLYGFADRLALIMATPFLLKHGYTQSDLGIIQGVLGIGATIVGVLAGGTLVSKLGINRSLWVLAVLQIGSNAAYYWLALIPPDRGALVAATLVENFCSGLVAAGFVSFLISMSSRQYSATQYALLSSFVAFARDVLSAPAGGIAAGMEWSTYFLVTIAAGIPALLMLPVIVPWNADAPRGAAPHSGEVEEAHAA